MQGKLYILCTTYSINLEFRISHFLVCGLQPLMLPSFQVLQLLTYNKIHLVHFYFLQWPCLVARIYPDFNAKTYSLLYIQSEHRLREMYIDDLLVQSLRARKDSTLGDEIRISLTVPLPWHKAPAEQVSVSRVVKTKRLCTVKMSREQSHVCM